MIDPTLFGNNSIGPAEGLTLDPAQQVGALEPTAANLLPAEKVLAGSQVAQEGISSQRAADRERAGVLASVGASMNLWVTKGIYDRVTAPTFEAEEGFSPASVIKNTPFKLTEDEFNWLNGAKSTADGLYRREYIEQKREMQQAAGDHVVASMLTSAIDPAFLVLTPLTARAVSLARGGSTMSGVLSAAGAMGVQAAAQGPLDEKSLILNGLINGAAGKFLYRPGKGMVKADQDFPDQALQAVTDDFGNVRTASSTKPKVRLVTPAEYVDEVIPAKPAVYEDVVVPEVAPIYADKIPHVVSRSTPNYGYRGENFTLKFQSDVDRAAYIVGGSGKSKAHATALGWAMAATGKTEAELVELGNTIRRDLKQRVSGATDDRRLMGTGALELPKYYTGEVKRIVLKQGVPAGTKRVLKSEAVPETTVRKMVRDAVWAEDVPAPLRPDNLVDPVATVRAVDDALAEKGFGQRIGEKLQWNMRKTMAGYGPVGNKIANLLFDNNSDLSLTSVESHRSAIRTDLVGYQHVYEDALRAAVADDGYGLLKGIFNPRKASAVQARIERDVQLEMFRREQLTRQGRPLSFENVQPRVKVMADALDNLHAKALQELKAAGVEGADDLVQKAGWHHRKWSSSKIDDITNRWVAAGLTPEKAHQKVVSLVGLSLRRANGWDRQMAYDVGAAIVNRALRTGYFEDALFNVPAGEGMLKQFRDLLHAEGVTGQRLERILDVMRQNSDDAGKAGFMKHRVDLDYRAVDFINGEAVSIVDLIDNRLSTIVDQYMDGVSTQAAFARNGLRKASDIEDLRTELSHSITDPHMRKQAVELFDNSINHMKGLPAGQSVNENMRLVGAYGRMIALANSGLWQATEYATMMKEYGVLKSLKYAMAEMPGFKSLMETAATDKRVSTSLKDILERHSDQYLRLRPFLHRFEDNFDMGSNDAMHLSAQQAGQLVPYVNVMKYIHGHQARMSANLIVDRLKQAAGGNRKAQAALQKYGIEGQVMDRLKTAITKHGANVDKWDNALWRTVRPAFGKMMDEAVLHQRLGDMPAFATFDNVGKFIFTYRSFVLTAHNKVLAGGMARDGLGAVILMALYQFPLAAMAVQAQSVVNGKGSLSTADMAKKAFGQMGALGAFAEIAGVATGSKSQVGAPGLIPVDRAIGVFGAVAQGNMPKAGDLTFQMLPVLSLIQPIRAFEKLQKEE